jgi:putative ABC transport system ATP-binding protein
MKSPPLIEVRQLRSMHVGPISFSLRVGENLVLSSPSGTGKSMLLRAIADLDPHQGEVYLDGREQAEYSPSQWRTQVGYLPAESAWWSDQVGDHFNVGDSVDWEALGFDAGVRDWSVTRLSSGERQRLAVLRLLVNRPRILLLDEPTANLDDANTGLVEQMIFSYLTEQSAAAVWVSHDDQQRRRLGARIMKFMDGHWQEQGND